MRRFHSFSQAISETRAALINYGREVDTGHWQGVPTEGKPDLVTKELMGWAFEVPMGQGYSRREGLLALQNQICPNLPWADLHFAERVSRVPSNPGEAYKLWPWWTPEKEGLAGAIESVRVPGGFRFTHTYQERFWPAPACQGIEGWQTGIRYDYGDLDDLVSLLLREPYTRQAYLPIFFPEDTGAVHRGRIPCTLGYHFLMRNEQLHMWYFLRSCDFVRHFRDDIYLAVRLLLWVIEECQQREGEEQQGKFHWGAAGVAPGNLTIVIPSLHFHKGDERLV